MSILTNILYINFCMKHITINYIKHIKIVWSGCIWKSIWKSTLTNPTIKRQFNYNSQFQTLYYGTPCLTYEGHRSRVNFFLAWYDNYYVPMAGKLCQKSSTLKGHPKIYSIGQISLAHNAISKIVIIDLIVLYLAFTFCSDSCHFQIDNLWSIEVLIMWLDDRHFTPEMKKSIKMKFDIVKWSPFDGLILSLFHCSNAWSFKFRLMNWR